MTASGWMIMVLSVGSVLTLVSFCLYRVLTLPPVEEDEQASRSETIGEPDNT